MLPVVVLLCLCHMGLGQDLVVQIENGKIRGTTIETPSGRSFYAWRGIPFGKPPLGQLRYLPPVKADSWDNVLDASQDSPSCIFFISYPGDPLPINGQSEDCLYINVYSPIAVGSDSNVAPSLPVMFYIYGGGFITGSGDFGFTDPTPFLEENVIVVTFNYRLGTFGFLSTEDDVVLGNAGLKDQLLALTWTKENIAFFGGNSSDITIFGESAGAMSVGYHLVSPKSKNLFNRAIMQSGCALSNYIQSNSRDYAYNLASQIDPSVTKNTPSTQIRDILQAADTQLIVSLSGSAAPIPVIEAESASSFLTKPLYDTLEAGNVTKVPIIIGHNSEESLAFATDIETFMTEAHAYDSYPAILVPNNMPLKDSTTSQEIGEQIHQQYAGESGSFAENLAGFLEWQTDNAFVRAVHKHATLQSKFSSSVYMYRFSYYGTLSKAHPVIPGAGNVGHADDVGYLFNISTRPIATDEDYLTRRRFVKLWTNFAKTSNPTPDDDSAELLQYVKWDPITQDNVQYLDINDNLQIKQSTKIQKALFWDHIWDTYSYRPYNTY